MKKKKESRLSKFAKVYFDLVKRWVPNYGFKSSKHIPSPNPQHIVLHSLRIKLRLPYREFVDMLQKMPHIKEALRMKD